MDQTERQFAERAAVFDSEDEAALEAATQRAMAQVEAGEFVSHDAVMRWVASWGTDHPLPPPECGE